MTAVADSVARYCQFFSWSHVDTVLDYGAGTMRNALYLAQKGFRVYAADIAEQVKVLRSHPGAHRLAGLLDVGELAQSRLSVDLVVSTYVFNIITQKVQRHRYLENVVANLRPGGYLLMEVCCRRDELACNSVFRHYFDCDDAARSYTHQELDRLFASYQLARICHRYSNHALAAIYRLAGEPSHPL